jgi:hypothetical protein
VQSDNEKYSIQDAVCQHCLKLIEKKEEAFFCPSCGTVYHSHCWEKEHGCAVISCSHKNIMLNPSYASAVPVRELLVHTEYLINIRKYTEALNECTRILNADRNNIEAKVLYNRAVSMINIKMRIYESAEDAFAKKEYKASAMFYNDYIKYCDEEESEFINIRIKYIGELLPALQRKKYLLNVLYSIIIVIIFLSAGFLAYRFLYLKEDIEYAEIEREDDLTNTRLLETQIGRYEKYLMKYPDSRLKDRANEKISRLSETLVKAIYAEDWRVSLNYLKKISAKDNPKTYNDLYKLILSSAAAEFENIKQEAKKLNVLKKFPEARNQVEKALALVENFSNTELDKQRQQLLDEKNLLNRKISYAVKIKDIDREISEKTDELKRIDPAVNTNDIMQIEGKVMKKISIGYIVKSFADKKLYAVVTQKQEYEVGEEVLITGYGKGKTQITDDADNTMLLPTIHIMPEKSLTGESDKNTILQRLNYLKNQKEKIDSLLKIGI